MKEIVPGIYEHFKGNRYRVLGIGKSSEDFAEKFVIYYPLYETEGEPKINIRPLAMFVEDVDRDGEVKERFRLIQELPGVEELLKNKEIKGEEGTDSENEA